MKSVFFIFLLLILIQPVFGQLSDKTGFAKNFPIQTDGYDFEIKTTSNFDIKNIEFSSDDKRLTLFVTGGQESNLSEILIPIDLIGGNFTFILNGQEIFPQVKQTETVSFIVLEFEGSGNHKIDIIGTTYLPEFYEIAPFVLGTSLFAILFVNKFLKKINYSFNND